MMLLFCPKMVKVPIYWCLALKSYIFNWGRSQGSFFNHHQRQFSFISLLFVLFVYISIVFLPPPPYLLFFLLFHLHIIDPTSTLHRTAFYSWVKDKGLWRYRCSCIPAQVNEILAQKTDYFIPTILLRIAIWERRVDFYNLDMGWTVKGKSFITCDRGDGYLRKLEDFETDPQIHPSFLEMTPHKIQLLWKFPPSDCCGNSLCTDSPTDFF